MCRGLYHRIIVSMDYHFVKWNSILFFFLQFWSLINIFYKPIILLNWTVLLIKTSNTKLNNNERYKLKFPTLHFFCPLSLLTIWIWSPWFSLSIYFELSHPLCILIFLSVTSTNHFLFIFLPFFSFTCLRMLNYIASTSSLLKKYLS